jgi:LAS superfamily LD-carboxypeptidase LdcB
MASFVDQTEKGTAPSRLAGLHNGRLPDSVLAEIPHERLGERTGYRMVIEAARAYRALHAAARVDNVILKPLFPGDTYRTFEQQKTLFESRYTPNGPCGKCKTCAGYALRCKLCNDEGKPVATAACPGESNHGWGLAVDLGTELDGDLLAERIDGPTLTWLEEHANRFGFSWETVPEEPWHIRYFGGDVLPQAVLDHEAATGGHGSDPIGAITVVVIDPEQGGDEEMPTHRWAPLGFHNQFEIPGCLPVTPADLMHVDGRGGTNEADPFAGLPLIREFHIDRLRAIMHRNGVTPEVVANHYFVRDREVPLDEGQIAQYRALGIPNEDLI